MINVPELFSSMVFDDNVMRARLPRDVYRALRRTVESGRPLDPEIASVVASAMKDWAVERGVTHFTHWFGVCAPDSLRWDAPFPASMPTANPLCSPVPA